jgi:hypothetical protein
MIAAILLTISTVTLGQFALNYWRAMISGVAALNISDRTRAAAGIGAATIGAHDFHRILTVNNLSPALQGCSSGFRMVRSYFAVIERVGQAVPALAIWADAEMTACSRYVAVLMDQHLERNIACAAGLRGM